MAEKSKRYSPDNTDENGDYKVGRARPPENGKFRKGDGRKRGRRKKGDKNLETIFKKELGSKVNLKINGKPQRVTKQEAVVMRLFDNAGKGQSSAIKTVMEMSERYGFGNGQEQAGDLSNFTPEELEQFNFLLCKYQGIEPPEKEEDPLAYLRDPDDQRNYHTERTVEGIHWHRCNITDVSDVITGIENKAYYSAALPDRKQKEVVHEN